MTETTRTTRQCAPGELNQQLLTAIRAHIEQYQLGDLEGSALICCETKSLLAKRGLFSSTETSLSGVIITPRWLLWAESSNGRKQAGSAQLRHIDAHNYEDSAMCAIVPDQGINITGRYTNTNQTGQVFIGLGSGPAAEKFRQILHDTMNGA